MKVLNYGSLNYDYVYSVNHIAMPKETLACTDMNTYFGGKGLNQSMALAKAGVPVYHAGMVGEDGDAFYDECSKNGIDAKYLKKIPGKSGHTIIQVDEEAQNCILLYGGSNRMQTKEYIDKVLDDFEKDDILILQNEVNLMGYIVDKAYEIGMQIFLNPSPFDSGLDEVDLDKISVFLINEVEGEQMTGKKDSQEILDILMGKYPNGKFVLTLGGDGVVYRDAKRQISHPAFSVKAVDTTAAGDTFTGFFVASVLNNMAIEDTLRLCSKAASIAVSRPGAADSIPTMEEVLASLG